MLHFKKQLCDNFTVWIGGCAAGANMAFTHTHTQKTHNRILYATSTRTTVAHRTLHKPHWMHFIACCDYFTQKYRFAICRSIRLRVYDNFYRCRGMKLHSRERETNLTTFILLFIAWENEAIAHYMDHPQQILWIHTTLYFNAFAARINLRPKIYSTDFTCN